MFLHEFTGTMEEINNDIHEVLQSGNWAATTVDVMNMQWPKLAKYNEGTVVPGTWVIVVQFLPGPVRNIPVPSMGNY